MTMTIDIEDIPVRPVPGKQASPESHEIKAAIAALRPGQSFVVPPELRAVAGWRVTEFNKRAGARVIHTSTLPGGSMRVGRAGP